MVIQIEILTEIINGSNNKLLIIIKMDAEEN